MIKTGDRKDLHQMRQALQENGYRNVEQVLEHGEFSARGAILDLFPMGSKTPYRLDFFDDEIEEIRLFDPETQRSKDKVTEINLLPAHEFPIDEAGINLFRSQYREQFSGNIHKESVYHKVSNGILPPGIEYYLPLFFNKTSDDDSKELLKNTLCDYLTDNTLVVISGDIESSLKQYWLDIEYRYENRRYDPTRPLLPPEQLFLSTEMLYKELKPFDRITIDKKITAKEESINSNEDIEPIKRKNSDVTFDVNLLPDLTINHKLKQPFELINNYINSKETPQKVLFIAESQGRRESVLELLERDNLKPAIFDSIDEFINAPETIGITVNSLSQGFSFQAKGHSAKNAIALVTESELLGDRVSQDRRRSKAQDIQADALFKNLAELTIGQAVVHIEHGIGRYLGLQTIENGGIVTEFLMLSYANDAKLYVPYT